MEQPYNEQNSTAQREAQSPLRGFIKLEPKTNLWLPEKPGDSLEGEVSDKKKGTYGLQLEIIDRNTGEPRMTPSHRVLQSYFDEIRIGDYVKIVFIGSKPGVAGFNDTMLYEVYMLQSSVSPVSRFPGGRV